MDMARRNPAIAPFVWPIIVVYLVFVLLTWFAVPAFNLLLRFNRFGRYALSKDQRMGANLFAICVAVGLSGMLFYFLGSVPANDLGLAIVVYAAGCALPLVSIYQCDRGWPRKMMSLYAAAMVLVGLVTIVIVELPGESPWIPSLVTTFMLGFLATPWVANILMSQTVKK